MHRATALIADDNPEWRNAIARLLEGHYHVLGFVARGDEVVRRAVSLQPDVITLDVSMPGKSGLNVLPELRVAVPNAAIIIVTTTPTMIYIDEAYRRGADGYVLKRNAASDLRPVIKKAVVRGRFRALGE
jgi:DNA-binding NarL/FixJ family response regulator